MKQILTDIKEEMNSNTVIVGDFNIPFASMDRSSRQKINDTLCQMENRYIQNIPSKTAENIFFSSAHGTFPRVDHVLDQKTSLNRFKKTEIISSIFSNHKGKKLEVNYEKKTGKNTNAWRLNNILLSNHWSMKK